MAAWIVLAVVAVLALAGWAYHTANRLDRLNVRVDLARKSLESSLDRRAVVVRAIAAEMDAAATTDDEKAAARDLAALALSLIHISEPTRPY